MLNNEILAQVAAGTMSLDEAAKLLGDRKAPKVTARRTAKGTLWMSLGYKVEKGSGESASTTLPRRGWEKIVELVKDGTIPDLLKDYDSIPLSSTAKAAA